MNEHLEIEFKTLISKEQYLNLLKKFDIENKTFEQTNFYFDTMFQKLKKNKTVLRIRKKEQYKLTKKEKVSEGNQETSIYLTDIEAQKMIKKGFDASIIGEPYKVRLYTTLKTTRAKTPYKCGTLFFDKSEYSEKVDYEIEFEVENKAQGETIWREFLKENNIEQKPVISKSERAFKAQEEYDAICAVVVYETMKNKKA